jgi:hypothetical protein
MNMYVLVVTTMLVSGNGWTGYEPGDIMSSEAVGAVNTLLACRDAGYQVTSRNDSVIIGTRSTYACIEVTQPQLDSMLLPQDWQYNSDYEHEGLEIYE